MKTEIKKLPKSQIEIEFELTAEEFAEHTEHALGHLKQHVKVDGFRPGQAPNKLVEDKIKPEALLMEAGDHAVQHVYSDYIKQGGLEAVGHPEIKIKKIAKGNPFIFTAIVTILPEIKLPDYKEIASKFKVKDISVTEQEIQDALNYLQKSRAKMTLKNDIADKKDFVEIEYSCKEISPSGGSPAGRENQWIKDQFILGEGGMIQGFEDNVIGMKAGEEKTFTIKFPEKSPLNGKEGEFKVKIISVQKMELPEINDEFAKQLGVFDTLVDLKKNMKEGMIAEKKEQEKQRNRAEILNKIAEKTNFSAEGGSASGGEIPETMVEYEKDRLLEDLKNNITNNMKLTFEQYLAAVKKTEQEIKDTFQKEAEKRLRGFLVLRQLGKDENIQVSDAELKEELEKSLKNYNSEHAGHNHAKIDREQLKEYTKGVLINEKIFQLLENFSQK